LKKREREAMIPQWAPEEKHPQKQTKPLSPI